MALPHLIGAPQPEVHAALAPADLQHQFVIASVMLSAVFWVLLGGLTGFFAQHFQATERDPAPKPV